MANTYTLRLASTSLTVMAFAMTPQAIAEGVELRCGWIHNPTPANAYLFDRDGRWVLSEQGRYEAKGLNNFPAFAENEWVKTNTGSYGYGCGCLRVSIDPRNKTITRVFSGKAKPLAVCRADNRLPDP